MYSKAFFILFGKFLDCAVKGKKSIFDTKVEACLIICKISGFSKNVIFIHLIMILSSRYARCMLYRYIIYPYVGIAMRKGGFKPVLYNLEF